MNVPHRRGACPGVSAPMATGDGLLVRIRPKAQIALNALIALCEAARQYGNGVIEISARGSIQVRGLTPQSASLFAGALANLDIAETCSVAVIADPLRDDADALIDSAALASGLRQAIGKTHLKLAPKVSITVDGGGRVHLDALVADIRLRAVGTERPSRLHLALGGDAGSATAIGVIRLDAAAEVVIRLLGVVAARGPMTRAADILHSDGLRPFRAAVAEHVETASIPLPRQQSQPIGKHPLCDDRVALGIAPAFGQMDSEALAQLAGAAANYDAHAAATAPGRSLLLSGVAENKADALIGVAEGLGFVVRPDDPRRRIVACPGRPACASGFVAARALAAEVAQHLSPVRDASIIHISGCPKGCAHPMAAALTVVGGERGCGIVHQGSARAAPHHYLDPGDVVGEIVRTAVASSEARHG